MNTLTPLEYLDSKQVNYSLIPHTTSFTAQETAELTHIKGKDLAKVIVVGSADLMSMVVVPADCILLQSELARILKTPDLTILPEYRFIERFPECEIGAMPPFGKLYGMNVFLARELTKSEFIIFNGGNHHILIKMHMSDFIKIAEPRIISFGYRVRNIYGSEKSGKGHNWHKA